jgi:hypothetical protein
MKEDSSSGALYITPLAVRRRNPTGEGHRPLQLAREPVNPAFSLSLLTCRPVMVCATCTQVGLLTAQYITLFLASATVHSESLMCKRSFTESWKGWGSGVCLTEEQVWCKAHPGRHADCSTADCRAEEIRLTLWRGADAGGPSGSPVYPGCSATRVATIHEHINEMNHGSDRSCAVCVPAGDRRGAFLPECSEAQASCRGLYFRPATNTSSWKCAQQPIDYASVQSRANAHFGC